MGDKIVSRIGRGRLAKRRLLAVVAVLCSQLFLWGCVTQPDDRIESPQTAIDVEAVASQSAGGGGVAASKELKPLLWEVRSPHGGHVSYLFGTIHVGVPSEDLPPVVWDKFNKAGKLIVEVDPEALKKEPRDPQTMMLAPDKNLKTMLGDDAWGKLVGLLGDAVAPEVLSRMKPHVVVSLALIKLFPVSQGMDVVFSERAGELKKPIMGLETYSFQEELLSKVLDLEMLRKVILNYDALRGEAAGLVKTYRSGDEAALSEFLMHTSLAGMPMDERSRQELIIQRNRRWVGQIRQLVGQEDMFIAVGAGHLPGGEGLIALLQKEGFTVKRVD